MLLLALVVGIPVVLVIAGVLWFAAPTLRTFRGPDFGPTYTDDETVFQVQQKFTPGTGGGA
jgi:hypothetical protein